MTACDPYHIENSYGGNFFGVEFHDMELFNEGDHLVIQAGEYMVHLEVLGLGYPGHENCFYEDGTVNTGYVYIDGDFTSISPINHLMPGTLVYIQEVEDNNVIDVVWNGEPNQINQVISDNGGTGIFRLEAVRTYLLSRPLIHRKQHKDHWG